MDHRYLRIGEFSERVGVSAERLRAWEQRYGVLTPERSPGGFRLYSDGDAARVRRMLAHLAGGLSAAEAARLALEASGTGPLPEENGSGPPLNGWAHRLRVPLERFDEAGAHALLDEALATFSIETVLRDVVLPCLADLGHAWAQGEVTVGQEHFASNFLRGRVLALAQGWGQGFGPGAVLATPPGERHDIGVVVCGVALARQGMRVVFLGADCPIDTLATTVRAVEPALVLLGASQPGPLRAARGELRDLGQAAPVYIGGAGASADLCDDLHATYVGEDPVSAAPRIAQVVTATRGGVQ